MLEKLNSFTFNHSDQQDDLYTSLTPAEIKQAFDSRGVQLKDHVNGIIELLNRITDSIEKGGSGADQISLTAIAPFAGTKLQTFLEQLVQRLNSSSPTSSGASMIGAPILSNFGGSSVASQLGSIASALYTAMQDIQSLKSTSTSNVNRLNSAESAITNIITRLNNLDTVTNGLLAKDQTHDADIAGLKTTTTNLQNNKADKTEVQIVQNQLNQTVIQGDSSVEAAQARVKADGTSFTTLRDRLNSVDADLAEKATSRKRVNPLQNVVLSQVLKEVLELDENGVLYAQELGGTATSIFKSSDNGNTWKLVYDFGADIGKPTNIKALDNGEIIVAIAKNTTTNTPASVYLSSQKQTVFTRVLVTNNMGVEIIPQFGMYVYKNIIIVGEYGTHGQGLRVYLSTDKGNTFKEILNLANHTGNLANTHVHGCFYDEYYERIWVTWGDGGYASPGKEGNYGIFYSDDLGATWIKTYAPKQCFGGYALENRVVFLGDAVPNGLWAYDREGKDKPVTFKFVKLFDKEQRIHYVASGQAFKRGEGYPLLIPVCFANGDTTKTGTKFLLATTDGINFDEIWRDTINHQNSMYFQVYAPTNDGTLLGQFKGDGRYWETSIKGNMSYSDVLNPISVPKEIKNSEINAVDLGIKGWEFSETNDLYSAIRFAANNKKTLVIPKDIILSLTNLLVKNIDNIRIKFDCDINEITTIQGIQHCMHFENCNNLQLEFNSDVSRTSNSTDSAIVYISNSKNVSIKGKLKSISPTVTYQKGSAVELVAVDGFIFDLEIDGFEYGYKLGQTTKVQNGQIRGDIKNCYKSPYRLFLLDNVFISNVKLFNNGIVGNVPNILGDISSVLNNVKFERIYFGKGNIVSNILLESITSASNVVFENCDFTEFAGGNVGTRIRKAAGITTRNNKGLNWQSGLTAAPTYTYWNVGEEIEITPVAGGYRSLVCVTAGAQGTWKGVGAIQA